MAIIKVVVILSEVKDDKKSLLSSAQFHSSHTAVPRSVIMPDILYIDKSIVVALKPAGVLSTDESGGMPELLRESCGQVRTVHRLDRVVSGLMVFARTANVASELSRQMREDEFKKRYLAVIHWRPPREKGRFTDLLLRDGKERKTYVQVPQHHRIVRA